MKKHNRTTDIDMLLSALLLSSIVIGSYHHWAFGADQKKAKKANISLENPLAGVSNAKILEIVQPFIISESVDMIIREIVGLRIDKALGILKDILDNKQQLLNRDDRVTLIMGVAAGYADNNDKNRILDLLAAYHFLDGGTPILFIAAQEGYPRVIPAMQKWYEAHAKKLGLPSLDAFEMKALIYAVEKKDHNVLDIMQKNGIAITKERASMLLNDAVRLGIECSVINELLTYGADINYAVDGYTPLLHAIKNVDLKAVQLIVDRGADVNKIGNIDVGNPRQVARDAVTQASEAGMKEADRKMMQRVQDAVNIENYLIEHDAKD